MNRCTWVKLSNPLYVQYHDEEWGVPVFDDQKLFEFITLEGAQAGLTWETIINRRENYRKAFKGFDPKKVAKMNNSDIEKLMHNPGIIRNRLKIKSTITNAQNFLKVQKEYETFSNYMWSFVKKSSRSCPRAEPRGIRFPVKGEPIKNTLKVFNEIPAETEIAHKLSKDMKRRGFKFFGPTICYAHMQAIGMVNDHTTDCFRHTEVQK